MLTVDIFLVLSSWARAANIWGACWGRDTWGGTESLRLEAHTFPPSAFLSLLLVGVVREDHLCTTSVRGVLTCSGWEPEIPAEGPCAT